MPWAVGAAEPCWHVSVTRLAFVWSQDSDLRSALLLEQAAHCFIHMRNPMVRKFAFHMILAGHRYSKAGQVSVSLSRAEPLVFEGPACSGPG